jgi:uncharacterized membrane protein YdjX (TVP38/TMEM64 family)
MISEKAKVGVVLAAVVALVTLIAIKHNDLKLLLIASFQLIEQHKAIGTMVVIPLFGLLSCLLIPTTFSTILTGIVFPFWLALLIAELGHQFGIVLSFLVGRTWLKPWIESKYSQDARYKAIDAAIRQNALKVVLLLRLTPVFPFGITNYILSTTNIRLRDVMAASVVGNLPGSTIHTLMGTMIGSLANADDFKTPKKMELMMIVVGVLFTIGSFGCITLLSRRALRDLTMFPEEDPEELLLPPSRSDSGESIAMSQPSRPPTPTVEDSNEFRKGEFTHSERRMLYTLCIVIPIALVISLAVIYSLKMD